MFNVEDGSSTIIIFMKIKLILWIIFHYYDEQLHAIFQSCTNRVYFINNFQIESYIVAVSISKAFNNKLLKDI